MSKNPYSPSSHFFVDNANLSDPLSGLTINGGNEETDAYGPVLGDETNKFRTTSIIRTDVESKVFAICDGNLLIQPNTDDANKVNLILKPSVSYAPFKIKYFIYRGVNISDLLDGTNITHQIPASPEFIKRIWQAQISLNETLNLSPPTSILSKYIGYDPNNQLDGDLLDSIFLGTSNLDFNQYNIPKCFKGELIGNFTGLIGLDIILDYGDFDLDYEEQLFKIDLAYARKTEHIFDISTIIGTVKQKRYKENIHQFIDAAAFWGSHIDIGEVFLFNDSSPKKSINEIYPTIVSKYHTSNKLYLYIQGERGRSYNYFGNYPTGKLNFELARIPPPALNLVDYESFGWPLLIKVFDENNLPSGVIDITLNFDINIDVHGTDKQLLVYLKSPYWQYESFLFTGTSNRHDLIYDFSLKQDKSSGQINQNKIRPNVKFIHSNSYKSISSFIFIKYKGIQDHPRPSYIKDLFGKVNIKSTFKLPDTSSNLCFWVNNFLDRAINLNDIIFHKNALLDRKVIFDNGTSSTGSTKERRTYVSILSETEADFDLSFPTASGFEKNLNKNNYELVKYGDSNFKLYKGSFQDGTDSIKSLALTNNVEEKTENYFFQLGILEEEYNQLLYDSSTIPFPLPSNPHLSPEIANIYFYFDEDISIYNDPDKDYRKFELGLEYEDVNGSLQTKLPSTGNKIFIYTIDGKYFFSKKYSEHQEFTHEFANSRIDFRPKSTWTGEYGIDWIRRGDSNVNGDSDINAYRRKIGHNYIHPGNIVKVNDFSPPTPPATQIFVNEKVEWIKLKTLYNSYPISFGIESQYNSAIGSLYPYLKIDGTPSGFPLMTSDSTPKCLVQATVELNIEINVVPTSLKLRFEKDHFQITSIISAETTVLPNITIDGITYSELEINNKSLTGPSSRKLEISFKCLKEFLAAQKVNVIANEGGIEKLAGQILMIPNTQDYRREVELTFINVQTDLTGSGPLNEGLTTTTDHNLYENEINKYLNSALINIKSIDDFDMQINPTIDPPFNADYRIGTVGNYELVVPAKTTGAQQIHNRLEDLMKIHNPAYNRDSFLIFFIREMGISPTTPSGFYQEYHGMAYPPISIDNNKAVIFILGLGTKAVAHELFHCGGLYHPFSNLDELTFEEFFTDNLMDYSELAQPPFTPIPTNGTWKRQWKILWEHNLIKKEI